MRLSVGSFCLNRMSHTSSTPSIFTVKKTDGLTGLQQASVRYDIWYLKYKTQEVVRELNKMILYVLLTWIHLVGSHLVHMMDDSLMSSDQMRAVQSPTVRKFLGKKGFLCRA